MRILLADDHPFYLDALERQLSKAFRGAEIRSFPSFGPVCEALREAPADLVILDFSLPDAQADETIHELVSLAGNAPVVIMSGVANIGDVQNCLAAGIQGYLPKTMQPRQFIDAVSLILHGGTYLPIESALPAAKSRKAEQGNTAAPVLDARDQELLQLIADGLSNKEIGRQLGVQEATVKFYVSRLFRRLGVKNRSQAVSRAVKAERTF